MAGCWHQFFGLFVLKMREMAQVSADQGRPRSDHQHMNNQIMSPLKSRPRCKVTHCTERVSANTRPQPHQLPRVTRRWGIQSSSWLYHWTTPPWICFWLNYTSYRHGVAKELNCRPCLTFRLGRKGDIAYKVSPRGERLQTGPLTLYAAVPNECKSWFHADA